MTYIVYYYFFGQFFTEDFTPEEFENVFDGGAILTRQNEGWMIV
jgi:hypothetical protein